MELELKHISPYLNNNLLAVRENKFGNETFHIVGASRTNVFLQDNGLAVVDMKRIKPILRTLSDLTKEIEFNGEKFVPIIALTKIVAGIYNDDQDDKFVIKDDGRILIKTPWDLRVEMFYKTPSIEWAVYDTWNHKEKRTHNQYLAFEKLFEWNFDVFNLIGAGLAIDINTLSK